LSYCGATWFATRTRDIGARAARWLNMSLTSNRAVTNQADFNIIPPEYQQHSNTQAVRQGW